SAMPRCKRPSLRLALQRRLKLRRSRWRQRPSRPSRRASLHHLPLPPHPRRPHRLLSAGAIGSSCCHAAARSTNDGQAAEPAASGDDMADRMADQNAIEQVVGLVYDAAYTQTSEAWSSVAQRFVQLFSAKGCVLQIADMRVGRSQLLATPGCEGLD